MSQFDEGKIKRADDGRFAEKPPAPEANGIELTETPPEPADLAGSWARHERTSQIPDSIQVITCDRDELDRYVYHPDWEVRADAAANPHLNDVQAAWLAKPTQPEGVRAAVAQSGVPGATERASKDPSATVRAVASTSFDLSDSDRQRLASDPAVGKIRELLAWS